MKQRYIGLLFAVLVLLFGVLLYATTRTSSIFLNQWLGHINDGQLLRYLQSLDLALPYWMVYSLSDGLWMLALMVVMLAIWDFRIDRKSIIWLVLAGLSGLLFELLQGLQWIRGSFDPRDLVFIFLGFLIPLVYAFINFQIYRTNSASDKNSGGLMT